MSGKQCYYSGIDHLYHTTYITSIRKNFWKNGMIYFDAHTDYCDDDSKYDHGVMILHTFNEKINRFSTFNTKLVFVPNIKNVSDLQS